MAALSLVTDSSMYTLQRVTKMTGDQGKENDLILCALANRAKDSLTKTVIFFGGDVQNYPEIMSAHQTNNLYIQWNLENTAKVLAHRFPDSLIMVVKPKEMMLNTFSIYSNFADFDENGIPTLFTNKRALTHIMKLYTNARDAYFNNKSCDSKVDSHACSESSSDGNDASHMTSCAAETIEIVGFSKGCVPLNQIMFEIATESQSSEIETFISRIKSVYWLDAGHNGRKDTWITNDSVLEKIAATKIPLFVHVSPYQVKDPNRPWIGKEEKKFIQKLKVLKANLKETKHHFDEPGSIDNHFLILTEF